MHLEAWKMQPDSQYYLPFIENAEGSRRAIGPHWIPGHQGVLEEHEEVDKYAGDAASYERSFDNESGIEWTGFKSLRKPAFLKLVTPEMPPRWNWTVPQQMPAEKQRQGNMPISLGTAKPATKRKAAGDDSSSTSSSKRQKMAPTIQGGESAPQSTATLPAATTMSTNRLASSSATSPVTTSQGEVSQCRRQDKTQRQGTILTEIQLQERHQMSD